MAALFVAFILSFQLPSYHLTFQKNGLTLVSAEDLTLSECKARLKTFKKTAHAQCVLGIGARELA